MKENRSPWVYQLDKDRAKKILAHDMETDVAIIGAGISGIATAFFILKYTDKRVVVLDKDSLGQGATGHNAGQSTTYFERSFTSMVDEYGLAETTYIWNAVESAWGLLDEIYTGANLNIPLARFTGYAGLTSHKQILHHLKENSLKIAGGAKPEKMFVSDSAPCLKDIPIEYSSLYTIVPQKDILEKLETGNKDYIAYLSHQKGCANSALLVQEVVNYLRATYPHRFVVFEHTPVDKVVLHTGYAILDTMRHTVEAEHVVLCTNGFQNIKIYNKSGLDINTRFHHNVNGVIGYMSGYMEKMNKSPIAISYFTKPELSNEDPYYYLTRRQYDYEGSKDNNLVCIGGPVFSLDDSSKYQKEYEFPEHVVEEIDSFVRTTYELDPNRKIDYKFTWHGLMGYTPSRIRIIGREPKNPVLLYNLGCNGVGLLPSIYGGRTIARYVAGETVPPSLFDPKV